MPNIREKEHFSQSQNIYIKSLPIAYIHLVCAIFKWSATSFANKAAS